MNNVTIDPSVLELREELTAKSQGFTSLAAKRRLEKHARSGRISRKAEAKKRARAAREQRWN